MWREAHLGRGLVKLRLHEDVCECFWNEICVWICLKERANMLNCSPYHVRSTWINRHHTNSFESRDCSAYLVIITQFDSNKNLNDSLHSALLRGFVFLDDMCQCFTSQSVQEPKCEFPPAATGIDPIYWQDWTAAVSSHRIVGMLGGLLSRPEETAVTGTVDGQNHASQGETYDKLPADVCRTLSINFTLWLLWVQGDALRLMVLGSLLRGAGVPVKITARATQTGLYWHHHVRT